MKNNDAGKVITKIPHKLDIYPLLNYINRLINLETYYSTLFMEYIVCKTIPKGCISDIHF